MALFFRVEVKGSRQEGPGQVGLGPYRDGRCGALVDVLLPYEDDDRHPTPNNDGALIRQLNALGRPRLDGVYFFGFANMDQLNNWFFDLERRASCLERAVIAVYSVPESCLLAGFTQAIAERKYMTCIAELPITTEAYNND